MKTLIATSLAISFILNSTVSAQEVRLTFDADQTDFGAFELSGVDTQLTLSREGGVILANDFAELNGLSTETYSASGSALGTYSPLTFIITTSGGSASVDTTGLDVGGGGIDSGESLSFVFNQNIVITEFDFDSIDTDTFAALTIGGSLVDFGSNSGDVHTGSFSLNAGQSLVFGHAFTGSDYDIQAFTFNIVPEPGSYALLAGILSLGSTITRRRIIRE